MTRTTETTGGKAALWESDGSKQIWFRHRRAILPDRDAQEKLERSVAVLGNNRDDKRLLVHKHGEHRSYVCKGRIYEIVYWTLGAGQ